MISANHRVTFKCDKLQKERIVNAAKGTGSSISDFARQRCLDNGLALEMKINEIHQAICSGKRLYENQTGQYKQNPLAKRDPLYEMYMDERYDLVV